MTQKGTHIHHYWPSTHTQTGALEVQVICPVEEVDEDEGEGEGQPWVVVDVVRVFHFAAVQTSHDFACRWHALGAAGLWRGVDVLLTFTGGGVAGAAHPGQHLLPFTSPQSAAADGSDDAVHLILTLLHFLPILMQRWDINVFDLLFWLLQGEDNKIHGHYGIIAILKKRLFDFSQYF